jgi:hypothetical protein
MVSMNKERKRKYQKQQLDLESGMTGNDSRLNEHNEEYSAEIAAPLSKRRFVRNEGADNAAQEEEAAAAGGVWLGWLALAASILSLFVWPTVLGSAAVVAGVIAFWLGSRALGVWSATIGLIALAAHFLFLPVT